MKAHPFLKKHPTRSLFAIVLFMMAVVLLLIAFSIIALRSPGLTEITTGRKTNVSKATFLKNYTVHYPIFHDAALDAIISRHTEEYIAHFEKRLAGKNDIRDHLTVNYEANHVGTITTSITFISKETVSGQPDVISSQHLVLDMQNKKQLTAQDVIAQNLSARQTLAKLLHDYFKQAGVVSSPLELVNLLELQLADLHDFSLDAHSLILYLNPHQPSITNAGLAPVAIDKSLLGGVLYDTYTKPDSDVQPADPLVASYHIQSPPPAGNIINPDGRMLALTFDDGPDNLTPSVLDRLDTYQSHATFFVLGHLVDTYKATLQRAIREGSEIGNHSWNHPDLRSLSPAELEWQVGATQAAIQVATGGYTPRLMRPPYGGTNSLVAHYLETHGLRQALWNVDTDDWRDRDAEVIYNRIMANAADGRIILLHDIHPTSVQAALRAIRDLKAQGFQLVTASDLYRYRGM